MVASQLPSWSEWENNKFPDIRLTCIEGSDTDSDKGSAEDSVFFTAAQPPMHAKTSEPEDVAKQVRPLRDHMVRYLNKYLSSDKTISGLKGRPEPTACFGWFEATTGLDSVRSKSTLLIQLTERI